jgi:heat shock protein HslJ
MNPRTLLGAALLLASCAPAAEERPPAPPRQSAAPADTLEEIVGVTTVGDATQNYRARVDAAGRLARLEEDRDYGRFGADRIEAVFLDGELTEYRETGWHRQGDVVDSVATRVRFDGAGRFLSAEKLVNGNPVTLEARDAAFTLHHVDAVRAAVYARWTAKRVPPPGLAGRFQGTLPAASSPGRDMTLVLGTEHQAYLTTDYRNGEPPIQQEGTWRASEPGRAVVELRFQGGEPVPPAVLAFAREGDVLRPVEHDTTRYGSEGLTLSLAAPFGVPPARLLHRTWAWIAFENPVEAFTIDEPDRYTITFLPGGRVTVRADCNRGTGAFRIRDEAGIALGPFALTRGLCPPESRSDMFVRDLERAAGFFFTGDTLRVELPADSGTLSFVGLAP